MKLGLKFTKGVLASARSFSENNVVSLGALGLEETLQGSTQRIKMPFLVSSLSLRFMLSR